MDIVEPVNADHDLSVGGRIRQFDAKNGAAIRDGSGWILYETGARREENPLGALIDPPKDPFKRALEVRRFHATRLRRLVDSFDALKWTLQQQAHAAAKNGNVFPPSEEDVARLKKLQTGVTEARQGLEAAEVEVEKTTPPALQRRRDEQAGRQQAGEKVYDILDKITV